VNSLSDLRRRACAGIVLARISKQAFSRTPRAIFGNEGRPLAILGCRYFHAHAGDLTGPIMRGMAEKQFLPMLKQRH
jgi:hypothetical protein